jgi:hypothetical protein
MKGAAVVLGPTALVVLSLAGSLAIADGESTATLHGLWLCQNTPIKETAYFAGIFEATADRGTVIQSFQTMLAAKYGYQGDVSCGVGTGVSEADFAKAREDRARFVKQLQQSNIKVLETGWQFVGGTQSASAPGPAAPAATAAPAAAPAKTYQCWMDNFGNNYITPAFSSTTELPKLISDWRAYIQNAHPANGYAQATCMEMEARQAASNLAQAGRSRVDWKE